MTVKRFSGGCPYVPKIHKKKRSPPSIKRPLAKFVTIVVCMKNKTIWFVCRSVLMIRWVHKAATAAAWTSPTFQRGMTTTTTTRTTTAGTIATTTTTSRSTARYVSSSLERDEEGRTIRKRSRPQPSTWDDFEAEDVGGGWDDFDVADAFEGATTTTTTPKRDPPRRRQSGGNRNRGNYNNNNNNYNKREARGGARGGYKQKESKDAASSVRKINMKALEGAGFVHLYGLASVLNALHADRRDFRRPEDMIDLEQLTADAYQHEMQQRDRKPEAQFSPWLFVQEKSGKGNRSTHKAAAAEDVLRLAQQRGIPVAHVDKGVLNTLSGNRPHQGYVLRCGKLSFDSMSRIPHPRDDPEVPKLWLALDEVVDPQNLGALLRSAFFIGGKDIGVLVCAKNSAPPSPVVSAASAGALELANVQSTSNLPRTLNAAREDGFRIVGACVSPVANLDTPLHDLNSLPTDGRPTILVLGSEGHGLRNLVGKACTDFVSIPGTDVSDSSVGVDSLNVSVTGGILLWSLRQQA